MHKIRFSTFQKRLSFIFKQNYHKPDKPWPRQKDFKQKRQTHLYYNFGLYALIFGLCYSTVPLYRLFCEHVGLEGDLDKKDYSMKDKTCNFFRKNVCIHERKNY